MRRRASLLVLVGALLLAACGGSLESPALGATEDPTATTTTGDDQSNGERPASGAFPAGASALDNVNDPSFPPPLVDTSEIISGGPPPDGIPPIDDPVFVDVASNLELLPQSEPVVVLEVDGDARAYPIRVMVWHEIVNDTVGGIPVSVTYCPLCNSAATYVRSIDGAETTFGTSGRLFASALVMYDRATETLWTHYNGEAVAGLLTGTQLEEIASPLLSWDDFRRAYPTGAVLDWRNTGFDRDYGRNPYTGYDAPENTPFLFRGALDDRAMAMQRVVGIEIDGTAAAYALELISGGAGQATNGSVGGRPVSILWKPGQASALDTSAIADGYDVGSAGVFDPVVDGEVLTFAASDGEFTDEQTGSTWSIVGEAVAGPLAGTKLERIPHLDTFWFAWSTYQPATTLIEG